MVRLGCGFARVLCSGFDCDVILVGCGCGWLVVVGFVCLVGRFDCRLI